MQPKLIAFALLAILAMATVLAACSAAPKPAALRTEKSADQAESRPAPTAAPAAPLRAPAAGALPAPPAAGQAPSVAQPTTGQPGNDRQISDFDRKIIYQTQLVMTVQSVADAIAGATGVAQRYGGYVLNLNSRYDGDNQLASLSLRVPSADFQSALADLRRLAVKVDQENTSSQDVTEEYVDLQSRQRNLEATEAQYLDLLKRAQTIDDILKIQQRLTEVRGQIEQIKGRLNFIQKRSELATISLELRPEALAKRPEPRIDGSLVKVIERAWQASIVFLRGVLEVILTAVVFFWWLIPIAGLAVWLVLNRRRAGVPAR